MIISISDTSKIKYSPQVAQGGVSDIIELQPLRFAIAFFRDSQVQILEVCKDTLDITTINSFKMIDVPRCLHKISNDLLLIGAKNRGLQVFDMKNNRAVAEVKVNDV